jgi:ketosteroid isomerase-like protein
MSQVNVEIVRKGFERFVATGEPAWDTMHEDVEVFDHDIVDGLAYRGHADVRRWLFQDWATAWSEWSAEPEEYIDAGEKVIVVIRVKATGRGSGVALERQDAIVYGMRDGVVVRMDYHNNRKRALKAAGLAG